MAKKNRPKKINLKDLGGFVFSTNSEFEPPAFEEGDEESLKPSEPVSYTHLTLPTIYSV